MRKLKAHCGITMTCSAPLKPLPFESHTSSRSLSFLICTHGNIPYFIMWKIKSNNPSNDVTCSTPSPRRFTVSYYYLKTKHLLAYASGLPAPWKHGDQSWSLYRTLCPVQDKPVALLQGLAGSLQVLWQEHPALSKCATASGSYFCGQLS